LKIQCLAQEFLCLAEACRDSVPRVHGAGYRLPAEPFRKSASDNVSARADRGFAVFYLFGLGYTCPVFTR
jgi:hypothetical protein